MTTVRIALKSDNDDLIEVAEAMFEAKEIERLHSFVAFVDRVRETKLLQRGMPSITNMSFTREDGMKLTCPPYENAELHELLHVLRPLILNREKASFQNIAGILGKRFISENIRRQLKLLRTTFDEGELKLYMQMINHCSTAPLLRSGLMASNTTPTKKRQARGDRLKIR